jgi:hypothetical protein
VYRHFKNAFACHQLLYKIHALPGYLTFVSWFILQQRKQLGYVPIHREWQMYDEFERMWKEKVVAQSWCQPYVRLQILNKIIKIPTVNTRCPGKD